VVRSARTGEIRTPAHGVRVARLSDQHTWLTLPEDEPLEVGDWVGLAVSHPCTTFDKWQLIPATRGGEVTAYIRTFF